MSGHYTVTRYGFRYGACEITRKCSTEKGEVYVEVSTIREVMEIKVTPTGLIRSAKRKKRKL